MTLSGKWQALIVQGVVTSADIITAKLKAGKAARKARETERKESRGVRRLGDRVNASHSARASARG
jgi:hypothetical protein